MEGVKIAKDIRVMTYNIAHCRGNNDLFTFKFNRKAVLENLDNIVSLIKESGAEVICLNEVDFKSCRSKNIDQADYIAGKLGFDHVAKAHNFKLKVPFYQKFDYGNAVISKYPIVSSHVHFFNKRLLWKALGALDEYKGFVDAEIEVAGRRLSVISTHFHSYRSSKRERNMKEIIGYLEGREIPFVVCGDMNAIPPGAKRKRGFRSGDDDDYTGDRTIHALIETGLVKAADNLEKCFYSDHEDPELYTYPAHKPNRTLDYIFASKDLGIDNYISLPAEHSDHLPVVCDIAFQQKAL